MITFQPTDTLHVFERELAPGDVLTGHAGRRYMICTIQRDAKFNYPVQAQYLDTGELFSTTLYAGNGKQSVIGGPKFALVQRNPARAWCNPAGNWQWVEVAS